MQDLEVKSLLLEAYVKGQQELLYVVPFVAKVLESSLRSVVIQCYSYLFPDFSVKSVTIKVTTVHFAICSNR